MSRLPAVATRLAVTVALIWLPIACAVGEPPHSPASATASTVLPLNTLLAELSGAIEHRDAAAWRSLLAGAGSRFSPDPDMLFDNLTRLGAVSFSATGRTRALPDARRSALGPDAHAEAVRVTWSVAGERHPAEHTLWLTTVTQRGRLLLAGAGDGPRDRERVPLWLLEPIRVTGTDAVVISGARIDPEPWVSALERAREAVGAPDLVAQLPSNSALFERLLGVRPDSYDRVAAATWIDGPHTDQTALRIMINPAPVDPLTPLARSVLLTHEAVHVRTRSPLFHAPPAITEGYADLVAYRAHPEAAPAALAALRADLRTHGIPQRLPGAEDFDPASPRISAAYPRAWVMAEVIDRDQDLAAKVYADCAAGVDWPQALERHGWNEASLEAAVHARLQQIAG